MLIIAHNELATTKTFFKTIPQRKHSVKSHFERNYFNKNKTNLKNNSDISKRRILVKFSETFEDYNKMNFSK